jgi:hypothetical protein
MYTPGTSNPPFGLGLDEKALNLVELGLTGPFKGDNVFNASEWVEKHTAARPYDNSAEEAAPAKAEGGEAATTPAAGGPDSKSPGIPGGTAGAAAGLAPTNP